MQDLRNYATDKEFLRSIAGNNYKIPVALDSFAFARALFSNFSSTDGELRDELSYMIFANGIIAKQKLTPEESEKLLSTALDNGHLFYRIGEFDTLISELAKSSRAALSRRGCPSGDGSLSHHPGQTGR